MSTGLIVFLVVLAIGLYYLLRAVNKRNVLLKTSPWLVYRWAHNDLVPFPQSSQMQSELNRIERTRQHEVIVVQVKAMQPGDTGWIHVRREVRRFGGGCLWLDDIGSVCSTVEGYSNKNEYARLTCTKDGFIIEAGGVIAEMSKKDQNKMHGKWYHATAV